VFEGSEQSPVSLYARVHAVLSSAVERERVAAREVLQRNVETLQVASVKADKHDFLTTNTGGT
jgi:hypothetical protein